jgi:hypothetical protein
MTTPEHPHADDPVLVDRVDACSILGVTNATFSRLCREGRFEDMVCEGRRALYLSSDLRRYRASDRRRGGSGDSVTDAAREASKSAGFRGSSETEIVAHAGERLGTTNDTRPVCEGCGKPFRPRRAGMRACSPACRQRMARQRRQFA